MQISKHLRLQAREYMRNTKELMKHKAYNTDVIDLLSVELRRHIITEMSSITLERIWFLRELEPGCRVDLALKLRRVGYNARERMTAERISIIMRGVAAKAGSVLTFGNFWGQDSIVHSETLRDSRSATALTYVEVTTLEPADLYEVLEAYPESCRLLQVSAMKIAMQKAIVIISEFCRNARHSWLSSRKGSTLNMSAMDQQIVALTSITGQAPRSIDEDGYLVEELEDDHLKNASDRTLLFEVLKAVQQERAEREFERTQRVSVEAEITAIRKELCKIHEVLGTIISTGAELADKRLQT
mmetsp:Transcript_27828/g.75090  ORF Transcript_27828/g.75090 Transcript_27828/m.75090 type:complete len:300 (-) Transcript_27828:105-1004(-)